MEEDGYTSDEDGIGEGWHGGDRDANGHGTECSPGGMGEEMWVINEWNKNKNGVRIECVAMDIRERFTCSFMFNYLLGSYCVRSYSGC